MHTDRDRNDDYYSKKPKKPDQPYYQEYQKQQQNPGSKSGQGRYERPYDNRQSRLGSEPRAGNNNFSNQDPKMSYANSDRNRDTRSSEPGSYEHRNKPPSGQSRLNNAAFQRIPHNLDNLPPRLKKKYLLEAGLPEDYAEKPIMEQSYSNTLPTGRGRNNRYDQQGYHHQNYQNSYQPKIYSQVPKQNHEPNYHHRSNTPPPATSVRPQLQQQQQKPLPPRYEWKSNDIQRLDDSSPSKTFQEETDFDWSEDVMNSQSLPHEVNSATNVHNNNKFEDNSRHRRRRRNRR